MTTPFEYRLELVSFKLCPFVQRSVITAKYKKAPYEITYIELESPPSWFEKISPMGKVPILRVNQNTVLFESAVINEFIDEVTVPHLQPADPLQKALERGWIEFGSNLLMQQYMLFTAKDHDELPELKNEFFSDLRRVEDVLSSGPYFRGNEFGLVDSSYAPLFMRLFLADELSPDSKRADPRWRQMPKVQAWAKALLAVPAVKDSVVPEFADLFRDYCRENGSVLFG